MAHPIKRRRRVLIAEPSASEAHVFSAFGGLPLLGPLHLGTILARAGFDVRVVSENLLGRRLGLADLDHDFLLLSCLTPTVERGYELATLFKRRNPSGKVLMGGPHVSFLQEEALGYADWVVAGEAEQLIVDLLLHGSDARIHKGSPVPDLDALPPIDWRLLARSERMQAEPHMFSRGCPFGCSFCSVTSMFGRRYRTMSVERVLAELDRPHRRTAFFYDDNFAADRARTHAILDGLLRRGRRFDFSAQVRADVTRDPELVAKMARAGCYKVFVGFESLDDRTLRELKKGQTGAEVRRAMELFHAHGIHVHGMFMFGADADGPETVRATAEFVSRARMDSVQFMLFTPFPGTEAFRRLEEEGRLLHRVWRYYDAMHVVIRPRGFTPAQLQQLALGCYAGYYDALHALRDAAETAAAAVGKLVGLRPPARLGTPCLHNAALKLFGSRLFGRWIAQNADYLRYLRDVSAPEAGPNALA